MWLCGPLLGVWADVGASPGDGEDQSFVAEHLDRSQDRVTVYVVGSLPVVVRATDVEDLRDQIKAREGHIA